MPELAYWEVYAMNRVEARRRLIQSYQETGSYSDTARLWHTSRHLVRKWVRRYRESEEDGLQDRFRRPHHSPQRRRFTIPSRENHTRRCYSQGLFYK